MRQPPLVCIHTQQNLKPPSLHKFCYYALWALVRSGRKKLEFCFLLFLMLKFKNLNLMVWHVTHLGFSPAPNSMPILSMHCASLACLSYAAENTLTSVQANYPPNDEWKHTLAQTSWTKTWWGQAVGGEREPCAFERVRSISQSKFSRVK